MYNTKLGRGISSAIAYSNPVTALLMENKDLLKNALTHTSYIHEAGLSHNDCNERLEFLGDTILNMIVSEYIYNIKPEITEGNMTKIRAEIICESCLFEAAMKLGYGEFLLLGNGELKNGGAKRPSILSDAFEVQ